MHFNVTKLCVDVSKFIFVRYGNEREAVLKGLPASLVMFLYILYKQTMRTKNISNDQLASSKFTLGCPYSSNYKASF